MVPMSEIAVFIYIEILMDKTSLPNYLKIILWMKRVWKMYLMAAMGLEENVSPYYFENNLLAGDKILLCSDGLYNELTEEELSFRYENGCFFFSKKSQ